MKKIILFLLLSIAAYAQPNITPPEDLVICDTDGSGFATFDLSINTAAILANLDSTLYSVNYYLTDPAIISPGAANPALPTVFSNIGNPQLIFVRVTNLENSADLATESFSLIVNPAPLSGPPAPLIAQGINNPGDEMEIFDLTAANEAILNGGSPALMINFYATYEAATQGTPVIIRPETYMSTTAVVFFRLENPETGCYTVGLLDIRVVPEVQQPTGNTTQTFTEGQTLANLEVSGQNILWYGTETGNDLLPDATVLVNNTTYYASQTINGLQSANRLGVTVSLTAGSNANILSGLTVYPNPASTVINFTNTTNISRIEVFNTVGQQILSKAFNTSNVSIDVSALANGIYFVKIQAATGQKTLRIVKE